MSLNEESPTRRGTPTLWCNNNVPSFWLRVSVSTVTPRPASMHVCPPRPGTCTCAHALLQLASRWPKMAALLVNFLISDPNPAGIPTAWGAPKSWKKSPGNSVGLNCASFFPPYDKAYRPMPSPRNLAAAASVAKKPKIDVQVARERP